MRYSKFKLGRKSEDRLKYIINENSRNPVKIQKKAKVLLLKSSGKSINDIIKESNLSKRTIINYVNSYLLNGFSYIHFNGNHKKSMLENYEEYLLNGYKGTGENQKELPKSYKEATLSLSII